MSAAVDAALALLPAGLVAERPVEVAVARRLAEQVDGDPLSPRAHLLVRELRGVVDGLRYAAHFYDDADDAG